MSNIDIKEQVKLMPNAPGCYQYFDKNGEIIYIGKAKDLKKRVSSYFIKRSSSKYDSPKLNVMVPQIVKIECIVVDSEIEALILESELIKKHKPKYNILLKDDKKFPYFLITKDEYPRIIVVRKANRNPQEGKYFGPYTDSRAMWATLDILGKIFPLKKCKKPKFNSRPCLYYDIGRCVAPCQRLVSPKEYSVMLKEVELFLTGKQMKLLKILEEQMEIAAKKQEFEKAARYRDSYIDVQKTMERQKVVSENTKQNQDFIGIVKCDNLYCASILEIREGRLVNKKDFNFSHLTQKDNGQNGTIGAVDDMAEISEALMREYYSLLTGEEIVKSIVISTLPAEVELYEKWLSYRAGKKVKISAAKKQKDIEVLNLAQKNAEVNLEQLKLKELAEIQNDYNEVGSYIAEKLKLKNFPHIIECYDISHLQGTNTVASRVVFENGFPKKSLYRRYKLRTIEKGEVDDFKSMREILSRRLKRIVNGQDTKPDLIIIDGGKGQLSSVVKIAQEMELDDLQIVSLAKREEEIFIPKKSNPVIFPIKSPALHLFQRIRDEAHRFAVTYHKNLRSKKMVE